MPGLQQLKAFSNAMTSLGGEPEIRKAKGQIMPMVSLPSGLQDASDSEDFVFGLPEKDAPITASTAAVTPDAENQGSDIDIDALLAEAMGGSDTSASDEPAAAMADDDIFNTDFSIPSFDADNLASGADDMLSALADFESDSETPDAPAVEVPAADGPDDVEELEELEELETTLSDIPLDDMLGDTAPATDAAPADDLAADLDFGSGDDAAPEDDVAADLGADFSADFDLPSDDSAAPADDFSMPSDDFAADLDFGGGDDTAPADDFAADLGADFGTDFDLPSDDAADAASPADDLNLDSFDFGSEPAETDEIDITQNFSGEFATTDIDNPDFNLEAAASESSDFDTAGLDTPADDFTLDGFDLPGGNGESGSGTEAAGSDDFGLDGMDFNFDTDGGDLDFNFDSGESASGDTDTPAEGGFSLPITDNPEAGDFSMPDAGGFDMPDGMSDVNFGDFQAGMDNDFETGESDFTESDFQIPGYSDFEMGSEPTTPTLEKKASGKRKRRDEPVKRTELSDEEHALFMKNLAYYPLNLRIEIEELIVSNDFTDEVIFEIIDKVLKRISARQLANQVEKLVDKHIPVPLNYEKRTAGEYEAYKQSLEYQLKNRIIPFTIGGVIAGLLIWLTVFMVGRFVVRPVRAELLYKEGYTLLENGLYPQSEQKFSEAVYYRPVKSWFFKFARGYRDQRQYERSADTYEKLLRRYNYDKAAGLEYARMELNDLINYQRAENIVRRWILDYHINDPDAILLLGDIYLDWATATNDADRYEDARLQYATLIEMYGRTDLYLSRMMRYFIRTDNIREVLPLKNYFYPKMAKPSKNPLEGQDMVELSGYMMEKLYGYLAPQDEFLRSSIEDVRDMLEKTVQQAPEIPESVYNFGRYFVENGNTDSAINVLTVALTQFENCDKKTHQRITRHINTYRLLGELYAEEQEYLKARQLYTEGLDLFIREQQYSALPTNEFFGHLYADIADLDYFISGDLDTALSNYGHAINNEYDTPSIRYRVGYIQYNKGNYREALGSFIKTIGELPSEQNALLALGNTLTLRNSIQAARGYYEKLIDILDLQRAQEGILYPQVQEDQQILVDTYMKASNNLAVVLSRIAAQTGDSSLNGKAMVYLQESIRAWDALTRNQQTMIRLEGSNLAQQNLRYMTLPNSLYDSEIYVSLPRTLLGEKALTQSAVSARR